MREVAAAVALAGLLVVAGCAAPAAEPQLRDGWQWPEDPVTDRLGWEDGVWYNESVDVDQSDGLSADERRAFVARTMARVERIRGLEFDERVPVEVIGRAEYRERSVFTGGGRSGAYHAWHNQVWEAALVVGEDRNVSDAFDAVYGGSVAGYYTPGDDRIVVVSDAERPVVDRATLAHELVHALQDQRFGYAGAGSRDGSLAHDGLTEGDARYVETLYEEACSADWSCVDRPVADGEAGDGNGSATTSVDQGLFTYIYQPYADGPGFVHHLRERGGWAAVNDAYAARPATTEQTIHPERYPEEEPASVTVPDRSGPDWSRFDLRRSTERLGEAGVYTMFWSQSTIDRSALRRGDVPYSPYNYSHPLSDGWAGDQLVPYHRGTGEDAEYGYVWAFRWASERDAAAFADGYRRTLRSLGAERVREGVFRVPDGPFADAFRVERRGRRVVVTNAPTVADLDAVHAPPDG